MTRPLSAAEVLRAAIAFVRKPISAPPKVCWLCLPLDEVITSGELQAIPGVGSAIADIIEKLSATGARAGRRSRNCGVRKYEGTRKALPNKLQSAIAKITPAGVLSREASATGRTKHG
jgi:hypothetical protein